MANVNVDEQVVHDLIRVIHTNQEALGAAFGNFNSAVSAPWHRAHDAYHPGALRYFEEVGMPVGSDRKTGCPALRRGGTGTMPI